MGTKTLIMFWEEYKTGNRTMEQFAMKYGWSAQRTMQILFFGRTLADYKNKKNKKAIAC